MKLEKNAEEKGILFFKTSANRANGTIVILIDKEFILPLFYKIKKEKI